MQPRIINSAPLVLAGLNATYQMPENSGMKDQWARFDHYIGKVPGQSGPICYGVCHNFDGKGKLDYLCSVAISGSPELPAPLARLEIPAQRYAIFEHRAHISQIGATWNAIFTKWLPESGEKQIPAPQLEIYGPEFDGHTGTGLVEIWIPVAERA